MSMLFWSTVQKDDDRIGELREKFTIARRNEGTPDGRVWVDCEAAEAWANWEDPAWDGTINLAADWDRIEISPKNGMERHTRPYYELRRPTVQILTLSAWIGEDGIVTEEPEQISDARWTHALATDNVDGMISRAARWLTATPSGADSRYRYAPGSRYSEALEIIGRRMRRWSYDRLETVGVDLRWVVEDHRIHYVQGVYRTRVRLYGSDFEAVRDEWIGGLPRKRRELLADDRFRRALNDRGKPVDLKNIKPDPPVVVRLPDVYEAPAPRKAAFRVSSWVDWTCPDTGAVRRGVVVEEKELKDRLPSVVIVLPDDGGEEVAVKVTGKTGKQWGRLIRRDRIKKGDPGTVSPAPVPSLDEAEWKPAPAPEPEPAPDPECVPAGLAGEEIDLFALFMSGPADTPTPT